MTEAASPLYERNLAYIFHALIIKIFQEFGGKLQQLNKAGLSKLHSPVFQSHSYPYPLRRDNTAYPMKSCIGRSGILRQYFHQGADLITSAHIRPHHTAASDSGYHRKIRRYLIETPVFLQCAEHIAHQSIPAPQCLVRVNKRI